MTNLTYVQVTPNGEFKAPMPEAPFKLLLINEEAVTNDWMNDVSDYLAASGCLYAVCWGVDCSEWDDAIDWANLAEFNYGDIPDEKFIMTTWHENEPISEAIHFAKYMAKHRTVELEHTVIFHVGQTAKEANFLALYDEIEH